MKSPLVEALRQATDNADATEGAAPEPADARAPSPGSASTRQPDHESAAVEFGESLEILPIDGGPRAEAHDPDVEFEESLDLQVANDDETEAASANEIESIEAAEAHAPVTTRPSRAPRIAVYAPFICIGVALAAGGSHFAYEWFGGTRNTDLAATSAKESESPGIPAQDSLLAPPTRFRLVVDQSAARSGDHREERLQAEASAPGSELP